MPAAFTPAAIDSDSMRRAAPDLLALALLDARNHSLHLLSQYERALADKNLVVPLLPELNPPLWELGHIAWFQERWIGRNLQRHQGPRCDPQAALLASVQPQADRWWDSSNVTHDSRWTLDFPSMADTRAYALATLESTLDLLAKSHHEDAALYFYRLALFHEDMHGEALIYMAQTLGLPLDLSLPQPPRVRAPLAVSARHWTMGQDGGDGFGFDNESPAFEVTVGEFEIDAQPVTWAKFLEFVADGGYERSEFWQSAGWDWLQQKKSERGGPRYIEQTGLASSGGQGAVMQTRFGQTRHTALIQLAMHLSWWEADAWCRWAGRRLPTEAEWEVAAHVLATRGFCWGQVWEWTCSSFSPYPGFVADPYHDYSQPWFGSHKVLRGASWATRARLKSPKFRNFYLPGRNDIFSGFRSCAI